jgi:hypothetical protein
MLKDVYFPSPSDANMLAAIPYKKFDQEPNSGWRLLAKRQKYKEAAELILDYLEANTNLREIEQINLQFNAGQMYAFADNKSNALSCFKKAILQPESDYYDFKWDAYVKGTIAFLEQDKEMLITCIENMLKGKLEKGYYRNVYILENMFSNLDQSYSDVYQMPRCLCN